MNNSIEKWMLERAKQTGQIKKVHIGTSCIQIKNETWAFNIYLKIGDHPEERYTVLFYKNRPSLEMKAIACRPEFIKSYINRSRTIPKRLLRRPNT